MNIYLSSMTKSAFKAFSSKFPDIKLNILLSYGLVQDKSYFAFDVRDKIGSLMLDSGTYTLFNKERNQDNIDPETRISDETMTVDGYKEYLTKYDISEWFDTIMNFDRDFNDNEQAFITNNKNLEYLKEGTKLDPIPVIHHFSGDEAKYYLEKDHGLIASGSAWYGRYTKEALDEDNEKLFVKAFNAGKRVHYLGWSNFKLAYYPIFGCDSTTWTLEAKYGKVKYWNEEKELKEGHEDKTETIWVDEKRDVEKYTNKEKKINEQKKKGLEEKRQQFYEYLKKTFDMKPTDLGKGKRSNHLNCQVVNIYYMAMLEKKITQKQKQLFDDPTGEYFEPKKVYDPVWKTEEDRITITKHHEVRSGENIKRI